jgi:hypothetical protein
VLIITDVGDRRAADYRREWQETFGVKGVDMHPNLSLIIGLAETEEMIWISELGKVDPGVEIRRIFNDLTPKTYP